VVNPVVEANMVEAKAAEPRVVEPPAAPASVPHQATGVQPAPAQDEALTRLAAIRRAAKTETPRRSEILPLIVAPDDPGPDAPRI